MDKPTPKTKRAVDDPLKLRYGNLVVYLGQLEFALADVQKSRNSINDEIESLIADKERVIEEMRILQSIIDSREES